MSTVVIAISGGGNVMKVFADKEVSERVLRGSGLHPHRDDEHKRNWYDANDHFMCMLYGWDVIS